MKRIKWSWFASLAAGMLCWVATATGADTAGQGTGNSLIGEWTFETTGVKGEMGQDVKALTQKFALLFRAKSEGGKTLNATGSPFGFAIVRSRVPKAKEGASLSFTTTYVMAGGSNDIKWSGTLSADGKQIEAGKFSFILGSGTFTATRKEDAPAK